MKRSIRRTLSVWGTLLSGIFLTAGSLSAQEGCPLTLGTISGTVTVAGAATSNGAVLAKGDTISTGAGSQVTLDLAGNGRLKLGPGSRLFVETLYCPTGEGGSVRLRLLAGTLWAQGTSTGVKVDITTHNFAAVLGTSTLSINARYLDTTFTLTQGTQEISTRDWTDTVDVQKYSFPFTGEISTLFALAGRVVVVPWGGRGAIVREGEQTVQGFEETHISAKPHEIDQSELLYTVEGSYRGPDM